MGRRLHSDIPQIRKQLVPNRPHIGGFRQQDEQFKASQKSQYNRRHRVRELPSLPDNTPVWVQHQGRQVPGEILRQAGTPRSYVVNSPTGDLRRNRQHLQVRSENSLPNQDTTPTEPPKAISTRSQTGTLIHPPNRLSHQT